MLSVELSHELIKWNIWAWAEACQHEGHGEVMGGAEVSQGKHLERENWWTSFCLIYYRHDKLRPLSWSPLAMCAPHIWAS